MIRSTWKTIPAAMRSHLPSTLIILASGLVIGYLLREVVSDMPSGDRATMVSGFGGAALGAVLGGAIAWFMAWQAAKQAERNEQLQRRALAQAAALRTLLKLQLLTNRIYSIVDHIDKSVANARADGVHFNSTWEIVTPSIGVEDTTALLDTNDFAILLTEKHLSEINECVLIQQRLFSLEQSLIEYSKQRVEFDDYVEPYLIYDADGQPVGQNFPDTIGKIALRKGRALHHLMNQIEQFGREDLKTGTDLCEKLSKMFREQFGEEVIPLLQPSGRNRTGMEAAPGAEAAASLTTRATFTVSPPFVAAQPRR